MVVFEVDIVGVSDSLSEDEFVEKGLVLLNDRELLQGILHFFHEVDDVLHVDEVGLPLLLGDVLIVYQLDFFVALINVEVLGGLLHVLVDFGLLLDDIGSQLEVVHLDHATVDDFRALLNPLRGIEPIVWLNLVLLKFFLKLIHLIDAVLDILIGSVVPDVVFKPQGAKTLVTRLQREEICVTKLELFGDLHALGLTHDDRSITLDDHEDGVTIPRNERPGVQVSVTAELGHDGESHKGEEILGLAIRADPIIIVLVLVDLLLEEATLAPSFLDLSELRSVGDLDFEELLDGVRECGVEIRVLFVVGILKVILLETTLLLLLVEQFLLFFSQFELLFVFFNLN